MSYLTSGMKVIRLWQIESEKGWFLLLQFRPLENDEEAWDYLLAFIYDLGRRNQERILRSLQACGLALLFVDDERQFNALRDAAGRFGLSITTFEASGIPESRPPRPPRRPRPSGQARTLEFKPREVRKDE